MDRAMKFLAHEFSKATLTPHQAVQMETRAIVIGKRFSETSASEFCAYMPEFRKSGAWARTPQHHCSFTSWARYAAPRMNLSLRTITKYASKG